MVEWDGWCIDSILSAVLGGIEWHVSFWIGHSHLGIGFFKKLSLLFLVCGWQTPSLSILFEENFLEMALGLKIEILNFLRVIDTLRIDLIITKDDGFPNHFLTFLKCNIEVLCILNSPE